MTITIPIEPGDTQADVVILLPVGCPIPDKARVVVTREDLGVIEGEVEVRGVAA